MTHRVSIGMPVYNGAAVLRGTLDSLLRQSFRDFELIISDNASTDETRSICEEYAGSDERIRYIRQPENLGALANFRFAFDQARGSYFMWAAHDDEWRRTFVERCVRILDSRVDVGLAFTRYAVSSRRLPLVGDMSKVPDFRFLESGDPWVRLSHYILLPETTHKANFIYGLWRREVLEKVFRKYPQFLPNNRGGEIISLLYALTFTKFLQAEEVLFLKKYPLFCPGNRLYTFLGSLKRQVLHIGDRQKETEANANDLYVSEMRGVIRDANLYNEGAERLLFEKRVQLERLG